jgi:hypothetical protein
VLHHIQVTGKLAHGCRNADARPVTTTNQSVATNLARLKPLRDAAGRNTGQRRELFFGDDLVRHGF